MRINQQKVNNCLLLKFWNRKEHINIKTKARKQQKECN